MKMLFNNPIGQGNAINRIKEKIESLLGKSFPGVSISNRQLNWDDNVLSFSFTATKLVVITVNISGTITVDERDISIVCNVPKIVTEYISEVKIQQTIKEELEKILNSHDVQEVMDRVSPLVTPQTPTPEPDDVVQGRPRRSHTTLWLLLLALLLLATGLTYHFLSGPSKPPKHIFVEQYELTVMDNLDNKPVANVDLYNSDGSLLTKIGQDGLLILRNIDITQHYQLVHQNYKIWSGNLPPSGSIYLNRLMAKVSIHSDQPYTATFMADRFTHVETAESSQNPEVQIPINTWVLVEFQIGPPSAWPRRQVMLNSPEDLLDIAVSNDENGPTAVCKVNHRIR